MTAAWRERLAVDPLKIVGYLLSENHPSGRSKAKFFNAEGFTLDHPERLEAMLLDHGRSAPVAKVQQNRHGAIRVLEGAARTPRERSVLLRSVWIELEDGGPVWLVTSYPIGGRP